MLVQSERSRAWRGLHAALACAAGLIVVTLVLLTPSSARAASYSVDPAVSDPAVSDPTVSDPAVSDPAVSVPSDAMLEALCSFAPPDWIEPLTDDWAAPICDLSQMSAIAPAPIFQVAEVFWRSAPEDQANTWAGLNPSKDGDRQLTLDTDHLHALLPSPLLPRKARISRASRHRLEGVRYAPGIHRLPERPPMSRELLQ